jgi:putative PIN family toxin of toxin-antitoxin system
VTDTLAAIRATIDANVLVVAPTQLASRPTPPRLVLDAWQAGRFDLVISDHVLSEVARTHTKPYFRARLSDADVDDFRLLLGSRAIVVPITAHVQGIATHPEDDLVLATAVSGGVDYLVTGDERFRPRVPSYRGIKLVSPAQFLTILGWPF